MPRLRSNPVDALTTAAPLATRWMERLLAAHEPPLTVAQFLALRALAREPLSGAELAKRAGVSGAAVSQLLGGLEQAGWLERGPGPDDRRRHELTLSCAGEHALDSGSKLLRERLGALLAALPRRELEALGRGLERLEALLGGAPPPRRPPHRHRTRQVRAIADEDDRPGSATASASSASDT